MAHGAGSTGKDKRDALAAAAAELFWTRGYAATSIAEIAAHAQVPAGNVYYYFKTKGDLAMAVADIFVGETEAMIGGIGAEHNEPRRRLQALAERLSRSLRSRVEHGCPIALCVRDFRRGEPAASKRAAESFALLTGFIARELGRTGLRPALALGQARAAIAEWQGGIALAHALQDATVLAESFRRMEQVMTGPGRA
ncbi:MAG: TetR/AcrR family transcriptional regulator [Notoacmeibacter sp.]|nr:TetR/AcrR family transcriptional regulator [Notoacmeibacter sp.]